MICNKFGHIRVIYLVIALGREESMADKKTCPVEKQTGQVFMAGNMFIL
jgi:hypothetical protein